MVPAVVAQVGVVVLYLVALFVYVVVVIVGVVIAVTPVAAALTDVVVVVAVIFVVAVTIVAVVVMLLQCTSGKSLAGVFTLPGVQTALTTTTHTRAHMHKRRITCRRVDSTRGANGSSLCGMQSPSRTGRRSSKCFGSPKLSTCSDRSSTPSRKLSNRSGRQ